VPAVIVAVPVQPVGDGEFSPEAADVDQHVAAGLICERGDGPLSGASGPTLRSSVALRT
jgi:hypothetical protein